MSVVSKPRLAASDYDRAACSIGAVHLGFGAFHCAHQAVFVDALMQKTGDLRWGIAAVNLRAEQSQSFGAASKSQGYILKSVAPSGEAEFTRIRPHIRFEDWSQNAEAAENLLALESVHMVTITVTESGYYLDDTGDLNGAHPVIAKEISGAGRASVYSYLAAGLSRRMKAGGLPITILCCDNIRRNGKMLKASMQRYMDLCGMHDLAAWVAANVTFPCSMVDRITPRTSAALRAEVQDQFGASEASPVLAEDFIQWVLEDDFAGPMPALGAVGVTITPDVDPYEETKIRILNGGHTCLAYLGALAGHATFDQAMADPKLFDHFWNYETKEVLPALTLALPFDKFDYFRGIAQRFQNRSIADSIERIAADGFAKFPIFILPTIRGCLEAGTIPRFALRSAASWYVFCRRIADGSLKLNYNEPSWDILLPLLAEGNVDRFARSTMLWADVPEKFEGFAPALIHEIEEMEKSWPK